MRKGGAQKIRGCTQGTWGCIEGAGSRHPRGPASCGAPSRLRPRWRGRSRGRPVAGPPLPRRTSGNVVRAAPLRKFFTLHVSLTAGLGFLGKGGQAGGRPRPRGGPQLLAETRDSRGTRTLPPPPDRAPPCVEARGVGPAPAVEGTPGGMWVGEGAQTRQRGSLFPPTPPQRGSAPGAEGPELPRSPLLLLQTPQDSSRVRRSQGLPAEITAPSPPFPWARLHILYGIRPPGEGGGPPHPRPQHLKCLKRVYSVLTVSEIKKKQ